MKLNRQSPLRCVGALVVAATLAGTLSACAPLILGGAAMSAMVAVDRRTSGAQLEDEGIELRAASRLRDAVPAGHINVNSYNRMLLVTGEVPNEQAKQLVEQLAARVDNVKSVVNELAVRGNSTLSERSSDTLITGKVKASLVDEKSLYVGAFKVVTERGIVYLMGRVTKGEADRATQITRSISGVQRVVRIFELLTGEELRQLAPVQGIPPAAAPAAPASGAR
jgi:osmotically-inducible protein OsmY